MGYFRSRHLSTFDNVRNWYERIKPVVSKLHTLEDDIRPIGNRTRKHERIVKINNNCYAMLTWGFDGLGYYGERNVERKTSLKDLKRIAPIIWERNPKTGEEFVTVHNARHGYATSLYEFLRMYLPGRMAMPHKRDGRQWIANGSDTYYLPLNGYVPPNLSKQVYFKSPEEREAAARPKSERKLVFKRDGENFILISEPYKLEYKSRTTVKRDEKAQFRNEIKEFKKFVMTMAPVLANGRRRLSAEDQRTVTELVAAGVGGDKPARTWGRWWMALPVEHMRKALVDEDNPIRLALVYAFIPYVNSCDGYLPHHQEPSPTLMASRLNNFVNIAFRFTKENT